MSNVQWAFAQAQQMTACEHCQAPKGESCRAKRGPTRYPCFARLAAYRLLIGEAEYSARHSVSSREWRQS